MIKKLFNWLKSWFPSERIEEPDEATLEAEELQEELRQGYGISPKK